MNPLVQVLLREGDPSEDPPWAQWVVEVTEPTKKYYYVSWELASVLFRDLTGSPPEVLPPVLGSLKMKTWHYSQNNVRGEFIGPASVYIRALTEEEAEGRFRSLNLPNDFCDCCGSRWEPTSPYLLEESGVEDRLGPTAYQLLLEQHYYCTPEETP